MRKRSIHFTPQNLRHKQFRSKLRRKATRAEKLIWNQLRKKQFGVLFRRQYSIKNYIVDLLCPPIRLIIELDGEYHDDPAQQIKDKNREDDLKKLKYTIIRYRNEQVFNDLDFVLNDIQRNIAELKKRFHWKEGD